MATGLPASDPGLDNRPSNRLPAADQADAVAFDIHARHFRRVVRWVAAAAGTLGVIEVAISVAVGEPRSLTLGLITIAYAGWLVRETGRLTFPSREQAITRIAFITILLLAAAAVLRPSVSTAISVAALVPPVLVLPFVGRRATLQIMILGGSVGIGASIAGLVLPHGERLPASLDGALTIGSLSLAVLFLLTFLWQVSRRMKDGAADLRSVVAMSGDLSQTMDPQLVGDRIAFHIAQAVDAVECGLNYWDRDGDRLVVHGYYPRERRSQVDPWYSLAAYPATRRVVIDQIPYVADIADPAADPDEVAFLASIKQRSIAIIPLVAAGKSVGTVELTSPRSGAFDQRRIEFATMLASEAAMVLENARLYDEIRHQAFHDGLTGLANRNLFRDRVEHALVRSGDRAGRPFAIMFIDLDDFKTLNDTLGHARGDEVLVAVAGRVADSLRPSDTAARLGGDEFAVLLEDIPDEETALLIAIRLADALREPMDLGDAKPSISASIGVVLSGGGAVSGDAMTADELLRDADVAMYAAKASSRGRAEVYRSALRADITARDDLAALLRGVEQRGELRLDYQPIVELDGGRVVGLEALVRWQRPDRPLLMPNDFIDLAEETGDIVPMGRWIMREACRQVREFQLRLGLPHLHANVNLSARQFQEPDLLESVTSILAETDLDPTCLTLEITESGLMQRTAGTVGRLAALRGLGVHLAIDDFGTGYSSLSYLERFPVDILKIDRSFIIDVSATGERSAIARAIVELGRTLGLLVVAEGIDDPAQAAWLTGLGCPLGQGYLFSRPLGVDAIESFLAAEATRLAQAAKATGRRRTRRRTSPPLRLVSGD